MTKSKYLIKKMLQNIYNADVHIFFFLFWIFMSELWKIYYLLANFQSQKVNFSFLNW